jgi:hypothetical protein
MNWRLSHRADPPDDMPDPSPPAGFQSALPFG